MTGDGGRLPWELRLGLALAAVIALVFLLGRSGPSPDEAPSHLAMARQQIAASETDLALVSLGRALAADPNSGDVHFELAMLLRRLGKEEAGRVELDAAAALDHPAALIEAGLGRLNDGDAAGAVTRFGAATRAAPDSFVAHLDLGIALLRTGQPAAARAAFARAIELEPSSLDARHNLGYSQRLVGDRDGAIATLQAVLESEPTRVITLFELGRTYEDSGRTEEARATYRRLLELQPEHGHARQRVEGLTTPPSGAGE